MLLSLLVAMIAIGQLRALASEHVELPCDVTPRQQEDQLTLILWYKNDRKSAPLYSVDARIESPEHDANGLKAFGSGLDVAQQHTTNIALNGPLSGGVGQAAKHGLGRSTHLIAPNLANRAQFILKPPQSPAMLRLQPLYPSDSGVYLCRVDFKWGRTIYTVSNLTVLQPVQKLRLLRMPTPHQSNTNDSSSGPSDSAEELGPLLGPLRQGQSVTIRCEAQGGK